MVKPNILSIKHPKPYDNGVLDIHLDTTGLNNEQVIAVIFFKEHPKSKDHFHIMLDKEEASSLFGWLTEHISELS